MQYTRSANHSRPLNIAVIGSGISGLSAAWLLSKHHTVTVFEEAKRIGGHSHTVEVATGNGRYAVDTGFMVYNEQCYPNLTALFSALQVPTAATNMSFSVSLDNGAYEYAGSGLAGLLAQPSNLVKPRFWSMLTDLLRFYRNAPGDVKAMGDVSLDTYLNSGGYGRPFREDHLYPMAAAIWSSPANQVGDQPAAAFVRFCENHGLLKLSGRPFWRTVVGGSKEYVARLTRPFNDRILTGQAVVSIRRENGSVLVRDAGGQEHRFDHAVVATHADRSLSMLADPSPDEARLLGAFKYAKNETVLHGDTDLMPKRRAAWASWNYLSDGEGLARRLSVSYWMNSLQPLGKAPPIFVTLNPLREPRKEFVYLRQTYEHPLFDVAAGQAQKELWSLQGRRNTWFCGAYFGAGFHEDGLQAGLAVAEDLGGVARPWRGANDSGRIFRTPLQRRHEDLVIA
jgi:uncharacterized protein